MLTKIRILLGFIVAGALTGCVAVALTAGGIAGGVAVDHTLSGVVYKTFSASLPKVRSATLTSLKSMEIEVNESKAMEEGEGWEIKAAAVNRDIDIKLEQLAKKATRMRVVVAKDGGVFRDSATGTEIIIQTAQVLDQR